MTVSNNEKQVNPRISQIAYERMGADASSRNISINCMASHILENYYSNDYLKKQRGDITVMRSVLRRLIPKNTDVSEEDAMLSAKEILAAMMLQVDRLDYDEIHKRIMEWHHLNHFDISFFDSVNKSRRYVVKHDMGLRWSEFQCIMYKIMLEKMGKDVLSYDYDDITYSIEIVMRQIQ